MNHKVGILLITIIIIITGVFVTWYLRTGINKVILEVGAEKIYAADYAFEKAQKPDLIDTDEEAYIYNKLIQDSILLQETSKTDGFELDRTIFNSPTKNYSTRLKRIKEAQDKLMKSSVALEGTIIAIWFFNNDMSGPEGYEKSKQITYDKIVELREQVAAKNISVQDAGEYIKQDETLAVIDPAYKSNAIYNFSAISTDNIVYDPEFNSLLTTMPVGEVSQVYTLKTPTGVRNEGPVTEALHAFAVIHNKQQNQRPTESDDLESYIQTHRDSYQIVKY